MSVRASRAAIGVENLASTSLGLTKLNLPILESSNFSITEPSNFTLSQLFYLIQNYPQKAKRLVTFVTDFNFLIYSDPC